MDERWSRLPRLRTPGLFVTGTDTGVGKTVAACLIADQLRRESAAADARSRVGALKPIATGCRRERERLISPDAEQLAHAADFDPEVGDLSVVNPIRFRPPLAPAAALEARGREDRLDLDSLARAMRRLDEACQWIVVEGIGGVMVPLEPSGKGYATTLDLMRAIGYPVVVVCRAGLGTLNHTALTCEAIRRSGLRLAGLVINGYDADARDASLERNRHWLVRLCRAPTLATLPRAPAWDVRRLPGALRDAIDATRFAEVCQPASEISR